MPDEVPRTCVRGPAGKPLTLACIHPNATIHRIDFAYFGHLGGKCGALTRGSCSVNFGHVVGARCLGRTSCSVTVTNTHLACNLDIGTPYAAISVTCHGWVIIRYGGSLNNAAPLEFHVGPPAFMTWTQQFWNSARRQV